MMAHAPISYAEPARNLLGGQSLLSEAEHLPPGFAGARTGSFRDVKAVPRKCAAEQFEHLSWQGGKRTVLRGCLRDDDLQSAADGSELPGNIAAEDVGHLFQVTREFAHLSSPIMFASIIKWNRIHAGEIVWS